MEKITFTLPQFDWHTLPYHTQDSVTVEQQHPAYAEQNLQYQQWGYHTHNTLYGQTFDVPAEVREWCAQQFDRYTCSVMRQAPGNTLPEHTDTFYTLAQQFGVEPKLCVRILIFLEAWQSGHYFEIDKQPLLNWQAGDAIMIPYGVPHLSGNMGSTPKYTMQVTGVKNEFKRR